MKKNVQKLLSLALAFSLLLGLLPVGAFEGAVEGTPGAESGEVVPSTPEIPEETPEAPEEYPEVPGEEPEVPEETPEVPDGVSGQLEEVPVDTSVVDISTVEQLQAIRENLSGSYRLAGDIDLSGVEWEPIGTDSAPFVGIFDGNGYTISNLSVNLYSKRYIGLFGLNEGILTNIRMENIVVAGGEYTGGVVGKNEGTVGNLTIDGTVRVTGQNYTGGAVGYAAGDLDGISINAIESLHGSQYVGGAVGYVDGNLSGVSINAIEYIYGNFCVGGTAGRVDGTIKNCTVSKIEALVGNTVVGGLVGWAHNTVSNCWGTDIRIEGRDSCSGGLVGVADADVVASYVDANITGSRCVGGLVGALEGGVARDCFSTGNVLAGRGRGGSLVGEISGNGSVSNCYTISINRNELVGIGTAVENSYFNKDFLADSTSTSLGGRTTAELQTASTYEGWDFEEIWTISEGSYPTLRGLPKPDFSAKEISTVEQLQAIRGDLQGSYRLVADLDLEGVEWEPIGTRESPFFGSFNGNGYTISNLNVNWSGKDYAGLFGLSYGVLASIQIENLTVSGYSYTGGIVGCSEGTVRDLTIDGMVRVIGDTFTGGAVGYASGNVNGISIDVINSLTGGDCTGGAVGSVHGALSGVSINAIESIAGNDCVGGVAGTAGDLCDISITAIKSLTGSYETGGVVGQAFGNLNDICIDRIESLTGVDYVGGIAGVVFGTVTDCMVNGGGAISGSSYVAGLAGKVDGTVQHCTVANLDSIAGRYNYVGGLVGFTNVAIDCIVDEIGSVTGYSFVGGLAGYTNEMVTGCSAINIDSLVGYRYVGGLVGQSNSGIADSYATADVTGQSMLGGLAGVVSSGTVERCYATGNMVPATDSDYNFLGGLIGSLRAVVKNSFSTGSVPTGAFCGGLVGEVATYGSIGNCYTISNNDKGLVGVGEATNSYFNKDLVTGASFNLPGGRTTAELKTASTYEGWDFETVWEMPEGRYPTLRGLPAPDQSPDPGTDFVSLTITAEPQRMSYRLGEAFDPTGLTILAVTAGGEEQRLGAEDLGRSGITLSPAWGETLIKAWDGRTVSAVCGQARAETVGRIALTAEHTVSVTVLGIQAQRSGSDFTVVLPPTVAALPTDPSALDITVTGGTAGAPETADGGGTWTFVVTDDLDKGFLYTVHVSRGAVEPVKLAVSGEPLRSTYLVGQALDGAGLTAALTYSDGSVKQVPAAEFGQYGISAIPALDAPLSRGRDDSPVVLLWSGLRAETASRLAVSPEPTVSVAVQGQTPLRDSNSFTVELPYGSSLPAGPEALALAVEHGTSGAPSTEDGGRTWRFAVVNALGEETEYTVHVSVAPEQYPVTLAVRDGATGAPLSGAGVQVVREDGTLLKEGRTGGDGACVLDLSPGSYRLNVYRDQYYSRGTAVTVGDKAVDVGVVLNPRSAVSGSLTVTEMTKEDMIQAGIDSSAPGNEHVFIFETELEFTAHYPDEPKEPLKLPVTVAKNDKGEVVHTSGPSKGTTPGGGTVTVYPITENFYLAIYGEAHWLKEMFDVELIVLNNSAVETIQGCEAVLSLPEGLSLAAMTGAAQSAAVSLEDIAPGGLARVHWYVRGDREGQYHLSAAVTGAFGSDGAEPQPFSMGFRTSQPVEVLAGSALHLYITAENRTWKNDTYNVSFRLENVSDRPVYDLSLQLDSARQYEITRKKDQEILEQIKQESLTDHRVEVAALNPGESIELAFSTVILFSKPETDELREAEYLLTGMFLKMLPGSTTSIPHTFVLTQGYRSGSVRYGFTEYNYMVIALEGDPVSMLTGAFDWSYEDLGTYGREPLSYTRYYVSDDTGGSPRLGRDWSDSYSYSVDTGKDVACVTLPKGEHAYFFRHEDGGYRAQEGSAFSFAETQDGYVLAARDGTVRTFDSDGALRRVTAVDGSAVELSYTEGRLSAVRSGSGQLSLSYNGAGRLASVTDGSRTVRYDYNESGQLSATTNPDGDRFSYAYDENGYLAKVTDANGSDYVQNTYDSLGRVTEQVLADQGTLRYTYDPAERVNTCQGENGYFRTIRYDELDRIVAESDPSGSRQYTYDGRNQRTTQTDALGRTTGFAYDDAGNVSRITYADGTWEDYTYNSQNQVTGVVSQDGVAVSYRYDDQGRLAAVTDPLGRETAYGYDGSGNLVSSTDPAGQTTRHTYDDQGNRLTTADPLGGTTVYTYDAAGRLASVTDPVGGVTRYTYSAAGKLEQTTDALGNVKTTQVNGNGYPTAESDWMGNQYRYGYDAQNNLTQVTTPLGAATRYTYDAGGNVTAQTDPLGRTTTYAYDAGNRLVSTTDPLGGTTRYQYDGAGQLVKTVDALGGETTYTYNALGERTSVTDPLGRTTEYSFDSMGNVVRTLLPGGATLSSEYDKASRPVSTTDADGGETSVTYDLAGRVSTVTDPLGRVTRFTYDAAGNQTGTADPLGGTTSRGYDAAGNLVSETDVLGRTTTYTYDALGRAVSVADGTGETHAEYDPNGNVTRTVDGNGNETLYAYDKENRLISVTDGLGNTSGYAYDAAGNRTETTDCNGNTLRFTYDALNRLTAAERGSGTASRRYDALGRVTQLTDGVGAETTYTYDAGGRLVRMEDALGNSVTYAYDSRDRVTAVTDALGRTATYTYDGRGNVRTATDETGLTTTYTYDAAGNRTGETTPDGTTTYTYDALNRLTEVRRPNGAVETYAYDGAGNLLSHTDPLGRVTRYAYDQGDRLVSVTDALEGETRYAYDQNGNLTSQTDALGQKTTYTYDALNRQVTRTDAQGKVETYAYDGNGNLTGHTEAGGKTNTFAYNDLDLVETANYGGGQTASYRYDGQGRLVAVEDWTGTTGFELDLLGRIQKATDAKGNAVSYQYDALGRRTSLTYPDGSAVTYGYDGQGRLETVTDGDAVTTYGYDAKGRVSLRTDSNGVTEQYAYDVMGNLTTVLETANGKETLRHAYTYDKAGNLTGDLPTDSGWRYEYDALDRLTGGWALGGGYFDYAYDAVGNLLSLSNNREKTEYAYDSLNRLTAATDKQTGGVTRYSYDGAGRLTGKTGPAGTEAYAYDPSGRLSLHTAPGGAETAYTYNALGVLLQTGNTELVSDYATPYRNLLTERTNGVARRYTYGLDRIGVTVTAGGEDGRYSLLSDRLGSTEKALDSQGRMVGLTDYDPWGGVKDSFPVSFAGQRLDLTSAYTGYLLDKASGLWYAGNRMYSAQDRRFTTVDPVAGSLSDPMSQNPYLYARDNPYKYVDPDGRLVLEASMLLSLAGGGDPLQGVANIYHEVQSYAQDPLAYIQRKVEEVDYALTDHYTYYTVLYCGEVSEYQTYERGVVSRVKQAAGGASQAVGGAVLMLASGGLVVGSGGAATAVGAFGIGAGASNVAFGASEFLEAFTDYNSVRDFYMGGDYDMYRTGMVISNVAGMVAGGLVNYTYANLPPKQATVSGGYNAGTAQPGYQGVCFVAGTLVVTENGYTPIEEVEVGDKVLSWSEEDGEQGYKEVTETYVRETDTLVYLTADDTEIVTTPEHPFYVTDLGWTTAGDLAVGYTLYLSDGGTATVNSVSIVPLEESVTVYNFQVDDWHTYFVSDVGVLVHNSCQMPASGSSTAKTTSQDIVFGSGTKSGTKLANQMSSRGWTVDTVMDAVDNPFTTRVSINKATGSPATVFYTQQGSYVIIDDITKAIIQISDNINPLQWIPDASIIDPFIP